MASSVTPEDLTGPAGEYAAALRARMDEAAVWLGLDPDAIFDLDIYRDRGGGGTASWKSLTMVLTPRGSAHVSAEGLIDHTVYKCVLRLGPDEMGELIASMGPMPTPPWTVSVWNANADDLRPGAKLYDAHGREIGEVGDRAVRLPVGTTYPL